jgi:hypothetical protein
MSVAISSPRAGVTPRKGTNTEGTRAGLVTVTAMINLWNRIGVPLRM